MITVLIVKVERYGLTLPECIQKGGDGIANSVDPDKEQSDLVLRCLP